jgi:hypothetical protein
MAPETMTVIEAKGHGGPDVLVPAKRPVPVPGPGEVLIEVKALVSTARMCQRQVIYPAPRAPQTFSGTSRWQRGAGGCGATR